MGGYSFYKIVAVVSENRSYFFPPVEVLARASRLPRVPYINHTPVRTNNSPISRQTYSGSCWVCTIPGPLETVESFTAIYSRASMPASALTKLDRLIRPLCTGCTPQACSAEPWGMARILEFLRSRSGVGGSARPKVRGRKAE